MPAPKRSATRRKEWAVIRLLWPTLLSLISKPKSTGYASKWGEDMDALIRQDRTLEQQTNGSQQDATIPTINLVVGTRDGCVVLVIDGREHRYRLGCSLTTAIAGMLRAKGVE